MYDINDKRAAVFEIQRYLWYIARSKGEIPCVVPDGIYSEETKACVMQFQAENGLEPTGKVDNTTFDLLYNEYLLSLEIAENCLLLSPDKLDGESIAIGEASERVCIIQAVLNTLRVIYENIPILETNGVFTADTERAVMMIQEAHGLNKNGIIDKATLNAIISDYNKYKNWDM